MKTENLSQYLHRHGRQSQLRVLRLHQQPNYKAIFPFIDDMGSVSSVIVSDKYLETKEEETLWNLNNIRDHDGLPHLEELPEGVEFRPIKE
jgi:hypothetical protein